MLRAHERAALLRTSLQVRWCLLPALYATLTDFFRRALKRRDVSGKNSGKDDDPLLEKDDDSNADLGKIVNLMQSVRPRPPRALQAH